MWLRMVSHIISNINPPPLVDLESIRGYHPDQGWGCKIVIKVQEYKYDTLYSSVSVVYDII